MSKIFLSVMLLLLLAGCSVETQNPTSGTSTGTGTATEAAPPAAAPAASRSADATSTQGGYLTGYVVSAFDMRVNGKTYQDSEDFYTQEMQSLTSQVAAAGYAGYTVAFDGQLGLDDLKYGMDVYVAAEGSTGYAGDTTVNDSGRFSLAIPDGCGDETFRIRTNKRINVVLTSADGAKKVTWCYNFSSADTSGTLGSPTLISDFTSSLTQYECENAQGGITIPAAPSTGVTTGTATGTDISRDAASGAAVSAAQ